MSAAVEIAITSNALPPIDWSSEQSAAGAGGGFDVSGLVLSCVRPRVRVVTPLGTIDEAPWGQPRPGVWKIVLVGVVLGTGVLAVLVWRGVTSFSRVR